MIPTTVYGLAVQCHRFAQQARIGAEPLAPEAVAYNGRMLTAGQPFILQKISAERGPRTQHQKQFRRDRDGVNPLRLAMPGEVEVGPVQVERRQLFEHVVLVAEIGEIRR